jgi:hypothetical protein
MKETAWYAGSWSRGRCIPTGMAPPSLLSVRIGGAQSPARASAKGVWPRDPEQEEDGRSPPLADAKLRGVC